MSKRLTLAVSLASAACVSQPTGERPPTRTDTLEHAPVHVCAEPSARALALLAPASADACALALELDADDQLLLRPLARENPLIEPEAIARGPGPESCGAGLRACELWGFVDPLGPIVLISERGAESEVPVQLSLAWVVGDTLAFAPTWFGPPSVVDHTRVGPAWALAPFDCEGQLLLLPAARLPEAAHEPVPRELFEQAGRWELDTTGIAVPVAGSLRESLDCRALLSALP